MALQIVYESEGFPASSSVANGWATLSTSWDDLLWAALTVGRPNRQYVFRYGTPSVYEALFRLSLVRMALEQSGPTAKRLRRTTAAKTLDPSEKGAVNYFLGLTVCKLFAEKLLNAPWMLHLDVFRPLVNAMLAGRSRPDLIGQSLTGEWISLECKGRITFPDQGVRSKAKQQALRVVSVGGVAPTLHIGGIAYFANDALQFYWRDPASDGQVIKNPITLEMDSRYWSYYYHPALDLVFANPDFVPRMLDTPILLPVPGADIEIGIYPPVLKALLTGNWEQARHVAEDARTAEISYRNDGIAVVAGKSWLVPFEEISASQL